MRASTVLILACLAFSVLDANDLSLSKKPYMNQGALIDSPPPNNDKISPSSKEIPPTSSSEEPALSPSLSPKKSSKKIKEWGKPAPEPIPEEPPEVRVIPSETNPPEAPTTIIIEPRPEQPRPPHMHFLRRRRLIPPPPNAREQPVVRDLKGQSRWDIYYSLEANTLHPPRGGGGWISDWPSEESLEDYEYALPYQENPEQGAIEE